MNPFESSEAEINPKQYLKQIQAHLSLVLNGKPADFQQFYRLIYSMHLNEYGSQVQNLTYSKITQVFESKLKVISQSSIGLKQIFTVLKEMTDVVDSLMKIYFYFEEMYYQAEKQTSLKTIAYNIIKDLLIKQEVVFNVFLTELTTSMFKIKYSNTFQKQNISNLLSESSTSSTISQQPKQATDSKTYTQQKQLMQKSIQLIHKLDKYPSKVLLFNNFLKDLYIKRMSQHNHSKIQQLKQNYHPHTYFSNVKKYYQLQQLFTSKYFKSKKTQMIIKDILRYFYSNWISENWTFLFTENQLLQKTMNQSLDVIYNVLKLDYNGLKQFTNWFNQLLANKLKGMKIINNESLVEQFALLYQNVHVSMSKCCDHLFIGKVKITFENWLNNDSIDIANRLNTYINSLILLELQNNNQNNNQKIEEFEQKLQKPMIIFKFVKDKDLFQLVYAKLMIERMVNKTYSRNLQAVVLRLIQQQCGQEWTAKIETIINQNNKQPIKTQNQSKQQPARSTPNNIIVINQLHWQALTSKQPFVVNQQMINYQKQNSLDLLKDKQVKWLLNYGNGILRMNLGKSFDLRVSTKSMHLLTHFNTNPFLSLKQYLNNHSYELTVFKKTINCLLKSNILKISQPIDLTNMSAIKNDIILTLNLDYIPNIGETQTLTILQQKDNQLLLLAKKQQLHQDRKLIIQAIITKLIKQAKKAQTQKIIQDAMKEIDKRGFSATRRLVEDCLTPLQDRGYIQIKGEEIVYLP